MKLKEAEAKAKFGYCTGCGGKRVGIKQGFDSQTGQLLYSGCCPKKFMVLGAKLISFMTGDCGFGGMP